jgi:hypothetical protein
VIKGRFIVADDAELVVLGSSLESTVERAALVLLRRSPRSLEGVRRAGELMEGDVRFAPDGVFVRGARVARVEDVLVGLPAAQILEVAHRSQRSRRRLMGIAWGLVAAGGVLNIVQGRGGPGEGSGSIVGFGLVASGLVVAVMARVSNGNDDVIYRR